MHMTALRRRLANEAGFSMALVMGVLMLVSTLGIAAYSTAQGDRPVSVKDRDRKQAYAAAEAGLNWYLAQLNLDPNYWNRCAYNGNGTEATGTNGVPKWVNNEYTSGTDTRRRRTLQGTKAQYALEVIPAPPASGSGKQACSQSTMVDENGSFRIRSTGWIGTQKRTVVARFARQRFLDFLYFTNYEASDPLAYPTTQQANAANYCAQYRPRRDAIRANTFNCDEIAFGGGDVIKGPMHSNDSLLVCPPVTFGGSAADRAESSQNPAYYLKNSLYQNCSGTPTVPSGTIQAGTKRLDMPTTNSELETSASTIYRGNTVLTLNSAKTITVVNNGTTSTIGWPSNGLLYVDSLSGCGAAQPPLSQTYGVGTGAEPQSCGNVYVKGVYPADLTIASDKDVVITGNLTRSNDAMLGLIAQGFVRVYHPTSARQQDKSKACSGTNSTGPYGASPTDITIEAAILSLDHSFTVDGYNCGADLGDLNVYGAIAQNYRGIVRQGSSGYTKAYVYDPRMRYRSPPLFLDPVNAAWLIQRLNEQIPAV